MLADMAKGFWVTFKHIFKKPVTLEYPHVKRTLPVWSRGKHKLQRYENGLERCVGCSLCAAVCPSEAIYVEAAENDPNHPTSAGERYAKVYQIHQLRCIWIQARATRSSGWRRRLISGECIRPPAAVRSRLVISHLTWMTAAVPRPGSE